ncbi:MAG: hypothetical protein JJ899_03780, partial [Alphaproteobacteria bacterium]|nr:hypothetical protein [Alphaproteobacteria bacterium]
EARARFLDSEVVQVVHRLRDLGAARALRVFFFNMVDQAKTAEEQILVAQFAYELGRLNASIRAAKRAHQRNNVITPYG